MELGLAKPTMAAAAGTASLTFSTVDFNGTITLGAILISAIVGAATLVTLGYGIRFRQVAKVLETERDVFQERAERLAEDLEAARLDKETYREHKHEQINALTAKLAHKEVELETERAKHDYTAVVQRLTELDNEFRSRAAVFERIAEAQQTQAKLLQRVAETLDGVVVRLNEGSPHV
jgi:hypothetical protein